MCARNSILLAAIAIAIGADLPALPARAESVVRYGISMADIPLTTGQPDRGAGAYVQAQHWFQDLTTIGLE
jgi:peptide/nickel transport system substrate-binding protein